MRHPNHEPTVRQSRKMTCEKTEESESEERVRGEQRV
jgi:hypothetical protein